MNASVPEVWSSPDALNWTRIVASAPFAPRANYSVLEGKTPKIFDPAAPPDIVVKQGEVEDWIIENRSLEVHAFHIHQLHFQRWRA